LKKTTRQQVIPRIAVKVLLTEASGFAPGSARCANRRQSHEAMQHKASKAAVDFRCVARGIDEPRVARSNFAVSVIAINFLFCLIFAHRCR
jgi:hypothetical protein